MAAGRVFEERDLIKLHEAFMQTILEDIKKRLETMLEISIKNYYESDRELLNYLSNAIGDICCPLKNAADIKWLTV